MHATTRARSTSAAATDDDVGRSRQGIERRSAVRGVNVVCRVKSFNGRGKLWSDDEHGLRLEAAEHDGKATRAR